MIDDQELPMLADDDNGRRYTLILKSTCVQVLLVINQCHA